MRLIEELSMNAWPALQTCIYDGWLLRLSNGYTKRANSVNPIYESSIDIEEKIQYCKNLYSTHGLPDVYKLTNDDRYVVINDILDKLEYKRIDDTSVQILNTVKEYDIDKHINIDDGYSDRWANEFIMCRDISHTKTIKTLKMMLSKIMDKSTFVTYSIDNNAIGFGYGVISGGYIGIFDLYVNRDYRGQGIGEEIVKSILNEGYKAGANKAYLQVVIGNTIAQNLYEKMGFKEYYKYWYRKK